MHELVSKLCFLSKSLRCDNILDPVSGKRINFDVSFFIEPLYIGIYQAQGNTQPVRKCSLGDYRLFVNLFQEPVCDVLGIILSVHNVNIIILKIGLSSIKMNNFYKITGNWVHTEPFINFNHK